MKILKPGTVEMRKFECDDCGCVFTADWKDADRAGDIQCPEERCTGWCMWESGEPYEEPTQDDLKRLENILMGNPPL